ncbi:replication-relaxation family protein [Streptomyces niveus]|uniref:replication-relaxation family protein n=1 Tax=Streptomyces niveus TaxID=193462 RepID=UPI0036A67A28
MSVNETVLALIRPVPDLDMLEGEPAVAVAAAEAAVAAPPGVGAIGSFATEVPLPATGTWSAPGHGGPQADLALTAPENGLPLLFVEVDNGHETPEVIAGKFEKYARFYRRRLRDAGGKETSTSFWETRWPPGRQRPEAHPPVLVVFNQIGQRPVRAVTKRVAELTRHLWAGSWEYEREYHTYDERIPIVTTTLDLLRQHGPSGPAFWRLGRPERQSLTDAVETRRRAEHEERMAREKREREARRPACADCGTSLTDDRWRHLDPDSWFGHPTAQWRGQDTHSTRPLRCDPCEEQDSRRRQKVMDEAAAKAARTAEEKQRRLEEETEAEEALYRARRFPLPLRH